MTLVGHRRGVWDAAFHPIELMLVSAGGDGMLKGWNIRSGECIWSIGEGAALMRCLWIYYNQVVTSSQDGIIKIWDIRKQTSLSYDKHEGKIWALDVYKNSEGVIEIISGGNDSVYHVWKDNTNEVKSKIMHEMELEEQ
jgi:U3 small nucleolar RNA-associated protein 13